MSEKASKGKGGQKIGRMGRKPAHARYNNENRAETNKIRKAAKLQKMLIKKAERKARKKPGDA
jgi:hypothetical protein